MDSKDMQIQELRRLLEQAYKDIAKYKEKADKWDAYEYWSDPSRQGHGAG